MGQGIKKEELRIKNYLAEGLQDRRTVRHLISRPSDFMDFRLSDLGCQSFMSLIMASIRSSRDFQADSNSEVLFSSVFALK